MGEIRIRVGASLDTKARDVFKPVVESAKRAKQEIDRVFKSDAARALASFESNLRRTLKAMDKGVQGLDKGMEKNLSTDKVKKFGDEAERVFQRINDAAKKAFDGVQYPSMPRGGGGGGGGGGAGTPRAARRGRDAWDQYGERVGYHSMRYFDNSLRTGVHMARSMANAAGFDTNLGSMVGNISQRDAQLTALSNSAWSNNKTDAEKAAAQNQGAILSDVKGVADKNSMSRTDVIGGLQNFVSLTGDLQTARDLMGQMATLSKATGANMGDMMDAAAQVANALPKGADKAKVVEQVMRSIAGQGLEGAVEIKDMATQMTKLAAMAPKFQLDKFTSATLSGAGVTDATGQNIAIMGMLAQASRAHGRTNATTASNSAMAFVRDLSGGLMGKRMGEAGLSAWTDSSHSTQKGAPQIILEMLKYAKGDQTKLSRLLPNQNSRAAVTAFSPIFDAAYKQAPGQHVPEADRMKRALGAVSDEMNRLLTVTMSSTEIQTKANAANETTQAKAQRFQNQLEDITEKLATKLIPAIERAEPKILQLVEAFGRAVAWAMDNPGKAIEVALVGSIARAGIENAVRTSFENIINGGRGRGPGGAAGGGFLGDFGGGTVGKVVGNAAAAFMIASVAIGTAQIGMAVIDNWFDKNRKQENKAIMDDVQLYAASKQAERRARTGNATPEDVALLGKQRANLEQQKSDVQERLDFFRGDAETNSEAAAKARDAEKQMKKLVEALEDNTRATQLAATGPGPDVPRWTGMIPPKTDFSSNLAP